MDSFPNSAVQSYWICLPLSPHSGRTRLVTAFPTIRQHPFDAASRYGSGASNDSLFLFTNAWGSALASNTAR
jgi:hypothetical protein